MPKRSRLRAVAITRAPAATAILTAAWPNDEVAALKQGAVGGDEISLGLVDDLDQIAADNLHYRAVERPALHPDLLDCFGARRF